MHPAARNTMSAALAGKEPVVVNPQWTGESMGAADNATMTSHDIVTSEAGIECVDIGVFRVCKRQPAK